MLDLVDTASVMHTKHQTQCLPEACWLRPWQEELALAAMPAEGLLDTAVLMPALGLHAGGSGRAGVSIGGQVLSQLPAAGPAHATQDPAPVSGIQSRGFAAYNHAAIMGFVQVLHGLRRCATLYADSLYSMSCPSGYIR